MSKKTRNIIIAVAVLLVLVVGALLIWGQNRPVAQEGDKTIVLEVVHKDGSTKDFTIHTDAETLRAALEQEEGLIAGSESEWGLMVESVDGEKADYSVDQSWWCLTKDGVMLDTGVDSTMIADGDHYEFTYTVG